MFTVVCFFISLQIQKTVEATSDALKNMHIQWDSEMTRMLNGDCDANTGTQSCASIKNSSDDLEIYYMSVCVPDNLVINM